MRDTEIKKRLPAFRDWLVKAGAQIMLTTSQWEMIRFKSGLVTSIIYRDKQGNVTFDGESHPAWEAFATGGYWRATQATKRQYSSSVMVRTLRQRDGNDCFFCIKPVSDAEASVEHLVPVTAGGPNHVSNFVLAHRVCNQEADCMSAYEKIKQHITRRVAAITQRGPECSSAT